MAIKPEIVDYINSHAEMVISEAKGILGTNTNREVELEFQGAEEFNFDDLSSNITESVVGIDFRLGSDKDGKIQLFIDKATAARVGSLMMMVEEDEVEFTEEHVDSTKETINQIMGAISTKMQETEDTAINVEELNGKEVELNADMFDMPGLIVAKFSLKIGDDEPKTVFNVLTSSSIEALMNGKAAAEAVAEEGDEGETEAAEETAAAEDAEVAEEMAAAEDAEVAEETAAAEDVEAAGEGEEVTGEEGDLDISGMLEDEETDAAELKPEEPDEVPAQIQETIPLSPVEERFEFLMDLTFPVSIELGRTKMLIKDILDLGHGSVIEFEKLAGEPVDLLVEDKKIAEGEVVVVDEHFGIRITNLVRKAELLKELSAKQQ